MDIFARQQAKPFFLALIRLMVMAALALATYGVLRVTGISRDFPPTDIIYFPFVTIICGVVIWRTFRQYNVSFWAYLGFERHRIGKDIAWGLLWLVVTYIPLIITLMGAMFSKSSPQLPGGVIATISILSAIIFLANAPIEEIIYRGWLQSGLTHRYGAVVAIIVQGLLFGLQHTMFAIDVRGMVVYGFAFFAWGVTAGIIVHKQRRLAPMVIAHWIVNLAFVVGPMLATGFAAL